METLDLAYNLVYLKLKVEHLSKSTLCLKYFRNIDIVMTKEKNKKIKIRKIYLVLLPFLPSQDGEWSLQPPTPTPQLFSWQDFLKLFFIDTWVSGQRVGKLAKWQSQQKNEAWGKIRKEGGGGGCNNHPS